MLDNALLAVVLDQINCTAQDLMQKNETRGSQMLCWLQFLSRSIVRPKTCCKKRDPAHGVKHSNEQYN